MRRGLAGAFALFCSACVGPNPRWDGPDDGADGDDDDDDTAASSGSSDTGADDEESSGEATPSDDSGGPMCMPDQTLCNGMCKDTDKDKHACGSECLDCVALLGMDAECDHGECREDNSGPG